ncbi:hypothetical protein VTO42DRAFT_7167 [Malbranchea cinnamomea]
MATRISLRRPILFLPQRELGTIRWRSSITLDEGTLNDRRPDGMKQVSESPCDPPSDNTFRKSLSRKTQGSGRSSDQQCLSSQLPSNPRSLLHNNVLGNDRVTSQIERFSSSSRQQETSMSSDLMNFNSNDDTSVSPEPLEELPKKLLEYKEHTIREAINAVRSVPTPYMRRKYAHAVWRHLAHRLGHPPRLYLEISQRLEDARLAALQDAKTERESTAKTAAQSYVSKFEQRSLDELAKTNHRYHDNTMTDEAENQGLDGHKTMFTESRQSGVNEPVLTWHNRFIDKVVREALLTIPFANPSLLAVHALIACNRLPSNIRRYPSLFGRVYRHLSRTMEIANSPPSTGLEHADSVEQKGKTLRSSSLQRSKEQPNSKFCENDRLMMGEVIKEIGILAGKASSRAEIRRFAECLCCWLAPCFKDPHLVVAEIFRRVEGEDFASVTSSKQTPRKTRLLPSSPTKANGDECEVSVKHATKALRDTCQQVSDADGASHSAASDLTTEYSEEADSNYPSVSSKSLSSRELFEQNILNTITDAIMITRTRTSRRLLQMQQSDTFKRHAPSGDGGSSLLPAGARRFDATQQLSSIPAAGGDLNQGVDGGVLNRPITGHDKERSRPSLRLRRRRLLARRASLKTRQTVGRVMNLHRLAQTTMSLVNRVILTRGSIVSGQELARLIAMEYPASASHKPEINAEICRQLLHARKSFLLGRNSAIRTRFLLNLEAKKLVNAVRNRPLNLVPVKLSERRLFWDSGLYQNEADLRSPPLAFNGKVSIGSHSIAGLRALTVYMLQRTTPRYPTFWVDAAKSRHEPAAAFAVAFKTRSYEGEGGWLFRAFEVKQRVTIHQAELLAIAKAVEIASTMPRPADRSSRVVRIFTDSVEALKAFAGYSPEKLSPLLHQVVDGINSFQAREDVQVHLCWVPSHAMVPGHVLANHVAKRARKALENELESWQ